MNEEETLDSTVDASDVNLEDAFQGLFKTSASGTGEEELLRIASTYSRQLSARMIKALSYLHFIIPKLNPVQKRQVEDFIKNWLEYKQYNNSDVFVMRALDSISLRKFIGENSFKVDIQK